MPPRRVFAHPKIAQDQGRVALMRGPLVYCLEGVDNGADLNALVLADGSDIAAQASDDLGRIMRLTAAAQREVWPDNALYRNAPPARQAVTLAAVPYYAWDNRAPGEMLVWIRREGAQ